MYLLSHRLLLSILLASLALLLLFPGHGQATWQPSPSLERAIVQEDWHGVSAQLQSTNSTSPVAGLLAAHAWLARNRNNEALCQFLGVSTQAQLQHW
jgi:hypothetical protein